MIISGMSISCSMRTLTLSVPVNGAGYPNTNRKQSELLRFSFLCSNFINSRVKKSNSSSLTFTQACDWRAKKRTTRFFLADGQIGFL